VALKTRMMRWFVLNARNPCPATHLLDVNGDEKRTNASGYPTAERSEV